ncbi:MAG: DNA primase [Patescibacteria group bacterium]
MTNLEEIKNKIDILDVVSKHVKLKKVGKYYCGLCPFHKETKPSFYVSPEMQIFKCFGCGEGGNVISFLMKIENLSFKDVLEKLKEEYGLEIKEKKPKSFIKKLIEINYASLKFFRQKLKEFKEAENYLIKRGLKKETIEYFELGYSPGGTSLRDYLYSLGYDLDLIQKAGLVDSKNFDRFQERIIFPLRNERGDLVGFTGRIFPERQKAPKYLNTPETEIFKKSQFIYGLFYSKDYIEKEKKVIVVEGQMDFILSFQNNLKNIIALSGSALTEEQIRKLKKYAEKIVFAFDNDEAGLRASLRTNPLALKVGFQTLKLIYPEKDLGEFFEKKRSLEEIKEENFLDWLLNYLAENYLENKKYFLDTFLPQIKNINAVEKDKYLEILSDKLKIDKKFLIEELEKTQDVVFLPRLEELVVFKNLKELLSFKLVSLVYSFEIDFSKEEILKILDEKNKTVFDNLLKNTLTEEEKNLLEMMKEFLINTQINPEKEFQKTIKELKKIYFKEEIKKLGEILKNVEFSEYDKILNEINKLTKELKNIEKNA